MNRYVLAMYLGSKRQNPETTWLDRIICWATGSNYSHAELIYDYDDLTARGKSWSASPRDGGVRPLDIHYNSGHWHLYEFFSHVEQNHVITWFDQRKHVKYDYLGAIGVVLPFVKQKNHRLFCFEAIALCMGWSDPHRLNADQLLTKPITLKRIL